METQLGCQTMSTIPTMPALPTFPVLAPRSSREDKPYLSSLCPWLSLAFAYGLPAIYQPLASGAFEVLFMIRPTPVLRQDLPAQGGEAPQRRLGDVGLVLL